MSSFYKNQAHNTTAAYLNGEMVECVDDNKLQDENDIIARVNARNARYIERVIFGHGRVALVFRTE